MVVRHREADLGDLGKCLQNRLTHLVQCLLQGQTVGVGKDLQAQLADGAVGLVVVVVDPDVAPARGHLCGQDAVVGLGQGGVLGLRVTVELRAGGLEYGQALKAGDHPLLVAVLVDDGGAGLGAVLQERVVVRAVGGLDAAPGVLLDLFAGTGHVLVLVHEVPGQAQGEVLDRADAAPFTGLGVDGVLLGVGRQTLGVVADRVEFFQLTSQLRGDVDVLEVVDVGVAVDVDEVDLGLAVLTVSESDAHQGVSIRIHTFHRVRRCAVRMREDRCGRAEGPVTHSKLTGESSWGRWGPGIVPFVVVGPGVPGLRAIRSRAGNGPGCRPRSSS